MKKHFSVTFLCFLLISCNRVDSGNKTSSSSNLMPTRSYEVIGSVSNPDIYEFTPKGNEHMTCIILTSGIDNYNGLSCFPKKQKKEK